MKLLFLGTGAADWAIKSEEETLPGERRRSSMLLGEHILIDIGPQSFAHAKRIGVDLTKITDIFISHTHSDHYNKAALLSFAEAAESTVTVHCHADAAAKLALDPQEEKKVHIHKLKVRDTFDLQGLTFTAFSANHYVADSKEVPLHYVISGEDKLLFYGCDGGWFTAETWEYMRKMQFDCMIFDTTVGEMDGNFRLAVHNSFPMLRLIKAALLENHMVKDNCIFIADHLAQTLHGSFAETVGALAKMGMLMAYDGFEIVI